MTPGTEAAIDGDFVGEAFRRGVDQRVDRAPPDLISGDGDETGDAERRQRIALRKAEMRGDEARDRQQGGEHVA